MFFCTFQALFWSLKFDMQTRLVLVSTKPTPHARHIVCETKRILLSDPTVNYAVTGK